MATTRKSQLKDAFFRVSSRAGSQKAASIIGPYLDTNDTNLSALTARVTTLETVRAFFTAAPAAPAGTTSTTGVMMGLGSAFKITPVRTGLILMLVQGALNSNTQLIGDGALATIRWGTGTAPANAAALVGSIAGNTAVFQQSVANAQGIVDNPFTLHALVGGLALNTAIWIDLAVSAINAGTASVSRLQTTAIEL